jgi:hypothetical protein
MVEDPIMVLGEDGEFGAVVERPIEGGVIVLTNSAAGDRLVGDDASTRQGDFPVRHAGIETKDGGADHEHRAKPMRAGVTKP